MNKTRFLPQRESELTKAESSRQVGLMKRDVCSTGKLARDAEDPAQEPSTFLKRD